MDKHYGHAPQAWCMMSCISSAVMIAVGVILTYMYTLWLPVLLVVVGAIILIISVFFLNKRRIMMNEFLRMVAEAEDGIASGILSAFPVPLMAANIDGSIRWHNEQFGELMGKNNLIGAQAGNVINGLKWGDVLKTKDFFSKDILINDKRYELTGRLVKESVPDQDGKEIYSVYLYFYDESEYDRIKKLYEDEKTDIAVVCIDNYDEVMQRMDDDEEERVVSKIRKCLNAWAQQGGAVIKRQDNDRYCVIFDHVKLSEYIEDKFSVVENVRKIGQEYNAPVSISIGIGSGGSLVENEKYSRSAMEMAQGRGGDQVCVKTGGTLRFYAGTTKEYEKSNRVKTRSVASALKELILNADKVFLMGHYGADYDCFGAAMGLQRAVRELGRIPYIVTDNNSPAIRLMRDEVSENDEYEYMLISGEGAKERINANSLLIILDTHRPTMLPCPELLERTNKVVVIDHHRRSTEFITPCALVYHEPYASSTCEMVTELMDYMDMGNKLTIREAEYLYTGILMDTKNFLVKTGVRTFEAASYLRKLGINTLEVKKLFNIDKTDYDRKVDIVKTAYEIEHGFAVAEAREMYANIRVIASQAADEMLNIGNIKASIVIYPMDNGYGICARSIGNINVQQLMESLGGGGHATIAGAQLKTNDIDKVRCEIKKAVHDYLKNI